MRAKRAKQYRKLMHHYERAFNFREPYQVLLDAEIIQAAARYKMHLGKLLETTLHSKIKPMITQCCIRHLYDLQAPDESTKELKDSCIAVAKQAERRRCGHHELETPLSTLECLTSVVDPKGNGTNKNCYIIATQEMDVRRHLRGIAGVPLIYINRSVMILEPMAEMTEDVRDREEKSKVRAGLKSRREGAGEKRKREDEEEEQGDEDLTGVAGNTVQLKEGQQAQKKQKRARGPKGPNPLSMKKKKTKDKPVGSISTG